MSMLTDGAGFSALLANVGIRVPAFTQSLPLPFVHKWGSWARTAWSVSRHGNELKNGDSATSEAYKFAGLALLAYDRLTAGNGEGQVTQSQGALSVSITNAAVSGLQAIYMGKLLGEMVSSWQRLQQDISRVFAAQHGIYRDDSQLSRARNVSQAVKIAVNMAWDRIGRPLVTLAHMGFIGWELYSVYIWEPQVRGDTVYSASVVIFTNVFRFSGEDQWDANQEMNRAVLKTFSQSSTDSSMKEAAIKDGLKRMTGHVAPSKVSGIDPKRFQLIDVRA
jgi:hypothetical protein